MRNHYHPALINGAWAANDETRGRDLDWAMMLSAMWFPAMKISTAWSLTRNLRTQ